MVPTSLVERWSREYEARKYSLDRAIIYGGRRTDRLLDIEKGVMWRRAIISHQASSSVPSAYRAGRNGVDGPFRITMVGISRSCPISSSHINRTVGIITFVEK
jgi:hypothetical protein